MSENFLTYDVGTNFDYRIFDIIKENDKQHKIKNLYGKMKNDGLPGGRNNAMIPDMSMDEFAKFIQTCKANGITFNYLINPMCLGQDELDPDQSKKIHEFIHNIYDIGVRLFTINSPSLIKYTKKEFSDVSVTLGLYAYPINIQHIEYWKNWGVDEITLDHSFNRNFELLKKVLTLYKDSDLSLRLIANNFCLKECPYRIAHGGFASHSVTDGISMDYFLINCAYRKISNPKAMITSEWIRPEDVHYYEELAREAGNKNFSLKLVDRTRKTEFIERVIKAYTSESYDGNLLDIINWPESKTIISAPSVGRPTGMPVGGPPPGIPPMRYMDKMNLAFLPRYGRVMNFPNIYIDNKKLDGFIEHFINNNNCANSLCSDTIAENSKNCSIACNHCGKWTEKAVTFNPIEVENWKENATFVLQTLENASMYKK